MDWNIIFSVALGVGIGGSLLIAAFWFVDFYKRKITPKIREYISKAAFAILEELSDEDGILISDYKTGREVIIKDIEPTIAKRCKNKKPISLDELDKLDKV